MCSVGGSAGPVTGQRSVRLIAIDDRGSWATLVNPRPDPQVEGAIFVDAIHTEIRQHLAPVGSSPALLAKERHARGPVSPRPRDLRTPGTLAGNTVVWVALSLQHTCDAGLCAGLFPGVA